MEIRFLKGDIVFFLYLRQILDLFWIDIKSYRQLSVGRYLYVDTAFLKKYN